MKCKKERIYPAKAPSRKEKIKENEIGQLKGFPIFEFRYCTDGNK